mmetsp:Transcript_45749/g.74341  ORF Transcript_45749/g.74341 Transcript_45749/m.74341 type:complete len:216 (+) Transcript_45749:409-1056(+)
MKESPQRLPHSSTSFGRFRKFRCRTSAETLRSRRFLAALSATADLKQVPLFPRIEARDPRRCRTPGGNGLPARLRSYRHRCPPRRAGIHDHGPQARGISRKAQTNLVDKLQSFWWRCHWSSKKGAQGFLCRTCSWSCRSWRACRGIPWFARCASNATWRDPAARWCWRSSTSAVLSCACRWSRRAVVFPSVAVGTMRRTLALFLCCPSAGKGRGP